MLTLRPTTTIAARKHLGQLNSTGDRGNRANQAKPVFKFPLRPTNVAPN